MFPNLLCHFFSNEIIEYLFSGLKNELEKEQRQIEEQNDAKENEQSVNLDDEELEMFVEQQKNENTKKKTDSDLRTWYRWCKSIKEDRNIEDIPPAELDRLLGHFYCKVRSANGSLYEPSTLTSIQRSLDRHLTKDHHKPFSIIRDVEFTASRQKLAASRKMLKKEGKETSPKLHKQQRIVKLNSYGLLVLLAAAVLKYCKIPYGFSYACTWE